MHYRIDFSRLARSEKEVFNDKASRELLDSLSKDSPRALAVYQSLFNSLPEGHVLDSLTVEDEPDINGKKILERHVKVRYPEAHLLSWDSFSSEGVLANRLAGTYKWRMAMITGYDAVFHHDLNPEEVKKEVLEYFREKWPQASVEEDDGDLFIYKDVVVREKVDRDGVTEDDDFVHVVSGEAQLTVVFPKHDDFAKKAEKDIRDNVEKRTGGRR